MDIMMLCPEVVAISVLAGCTAIACLVAGLVGLIARKGQKRS